MIIELSEAEVSYLLNAINSSEIELNHFEDEVGPVERLDTTGLVAKLEGKAHTHDISVSR